MAKKKTYDLADIPLEALRFADKVLKEFRERDETRAKSKFPVWKTIEIKDYGTAEEVEAKLMAEKFLDSEQSSHIKKQLRMAAPSHFGKTISLVKTNFQGLGLEQDATVAKIYARAQELGLALCPVLSGICLLLQHGSLVLDIFFCSERYYLPDGLSMSGLSKSRLVAIAANDNRAWGSAFDFSSDTAFIFAYPY